MLTDKRLQEIKWRIEKATKGPWMHSKEYCGGVSTEIELGNIADCWISHNDENDAEFIAHARQDVPALVAEVERVQADFEQERKDCLRLHAENLHLQKENNRHEQGLLDETFNDFVAIRRLDRVELAEAKARMENERLLEENAHLRKQQLQLISDYQNDLECLDERVVQNKKLIIETTKLREALEEYAAKEKYERVAYDPELYEGGYVQSNWEPSWIEFDKGETARKVLEGE